MRFLKRLLLACLLLAVLAGGAAWWCLHAFTAPGPLAEGKTVLVTRGLGFERIADLLAEQGVVRHALYFKAASALTGDAVRFKAGEYAFPAGISVAGVLSMLAEGKVVIHKVTLPEGIPVREVVRLLEAEPVLEGATPAAVPEGSLLPETYYFSYGDSRAELIARMQSAARAVLEEQWSKRQPGLPLATPQEALVLASIVEKETGMPAERARVAAVYINRLRLGMKLQADPTVAYGLELAAGSPLGRALTLADLQTPTLYNTYMNTGLPPTPIANPGRDAIAATLNPADTKEIYFVATGQGGHNFAQTLEQHNRNVAVYRASRAE